MKSHKLSNKINRALELPRELSDNTNVTIVEYEEFYIRVKTDIGNININGFNLNLEQVTEDDILVKGKIQNIEIERMQEEGE